MTPLLFALLFAQAELQPAPVEVSVTLRAGEDPAGEVIATSSAPSEGPAELRLAVPLTLELTVVGQAGDDVFPPMLPALGAFEIVRPGPGSERVDGERKTITRRWQILPVRVGVEKLPPLEVPYRTLDGAEGSVSTPPLRVLVRGHLENEADPALGGAPPPVSIITTNWTLIWALSVGGALLLSALLGWVVLLAMRQRFEALKPKPPPRPANEVALARLDQLERTPDQELDGGRRVAETVDTLREYLGHRYDIDALEMTTNELAHAIRTVDLRGASADAILELLASADLVKFARLVPPPEEARAPAALVRALVETTWVEVERVEEELVRAEPATLRQRFFAGLVDGMSAGLIGGLAFLGLFVAGLAELGWLALVGIGLLLVLRDAGLSPGKRLLRVTVVSRDARQSAPGVGRLLRRNLLLLLWPITLPIEWLVLRTHPLMLRLGDLWADTEVVRDRRQGGRS